MHTIGVDQSTSATKALLFDENANIVAKTARPHQQIYPRPGWVEHDADEIYQNTLAAIGELVERHPEAASTCGCLSITNQRETFVIFDRSTGRPLHNAIVWQCRRGIDICTEMSTFADEIRAATGLPLDTYFPASKIRHLLQSRPDIAEQVRNGQALIGTIDCYLIYRLTGGAVFATDHTNASRTLLYDLHDLAWSQSLCDLFTVPVGALPEIRGCDAHYGVTDCGGAFQAPAPIAGVIGDQQAALCAQRCFTPGSMKATLGTGCFVLVNTGERPIIGAEGIVTAVAWVTGGTPRYAVEGIINYAGATINWMRDQLGLISDPAETAALSESVPDSGGVYLVPAFVGLSAPHWSPNARAAITGLTPSSTRAHIVRAALESIAYQIADVASALPKMRAGKSDVLKLDGGMVDNRFLMQFIADVIGQTISVSAESDLSAVGAAYMGQIAIGMRRSLLDFVELPRAEERFTPVQDRTSAIRSYAGWKVAVESVVRDAHRREAPGESHGSSQHERQDLLSANTGD